MVVNRGAVRKSTVTLIGLELTGGVPGFTTVKATAPFCAIVKTALSRTTCVGLLYVVVNVVALPSIWTTAFESNPEPLSVTLILSPAYRDVGETELISGCPFFEARQTRCP